MSYRIIYPNDVNGIDVIVPAPGVTESQALSSVPTGKPYLVLQAGDVPTDRTFRAAWTADFINAPIKQ